MWGLPGLTLLKLQLLIQDCQDRRDLCLDSRTLWEGGCLALLVSVFTSKHRGSDGALQPSGSFWLARHLTVRCFIYLCDVTTNQQCQQPPHATLRWP